MTFIPDVRNKKKITPFGKTDMENGYWHGYLDNKDLEFMTGYDYCAEMVVSNFFNNLGVFSTDIKDALSLFNLSEGNNEDEEDISEIEEFFENIDNKVLLTTKSLDEFSDNEIAVMDKYTRLFKTIKDCLLNWIELERDELGVSMIEGMDEKEYKRIKEAVDKGERETCYTKLDGDCLYLKEEE